MIRLSGLFYKALSDNISCELVLIRLNHFFSFFIHSYIPFFILFFFLSPSVLLFFQSSLYVSFLSLLFATSWFLSCSMSKTWSLWGYLPLFPHKLLFFARWNKRTELWRTESGHVSKFDQSNVETLYPGIRRIFWKEERSRYAKLVKTHPQKPATVITAKEYSGRLNKNYFYNLKIMNHFLSTSYFWTTLCWSNT